MKQTELTAEKICDRAAKKNNAAIRKFADGLFDFDEIEKISYDKLEKTLYRNTIAALRGVYLYAYEAELRKKKRIPYDELDAIDAAEILKLIRKHIKNWKNKVERVKKAAKKGEIEEEKAKNTIKAITGKRGESGLTYQIMRILRTEGNAAQAKASIAAYESEGVSYYQYHAILDNRECTICHELDGRIFATSSAVRGKTLPPIHPNCRCYTTPYNIKL